MKEKFLTMTSAELDNYLDSLQTVLAKSCAYTTIRKIKPKYHYKQN